MIVSAQDEPLFDAYYEPYFLNALNNKCIVCRLFALTSLSQPISIARPSVTSTTWQVLRDSAYWPKTLLLITCDEHGGFFDHVPPPANCPNSDGLNASDASSAL